MQSKIVILAYFSAISLAWRRIIATTSSTFKTTISCYYVFDETELYYLFSFYVLLIILLSLSIISDVILVVTVSITISLSD